MKLIDKDALLNRMQKDPLFDLVERYGVSGVINAEPTVDAEPVIRCKDCKFHHDRTQCNKRIGAWFDDDYCNGAVRAERKEE